MADFPDSIPVTEIPRQIVEAEIELLIGLLDTLDPDPDLEDTADNELTGDEEPLHGAPEHVTGSWRGIQESACFAEGEELELGWTELEARFGRYGAAGEDVYEPSLGSLASMNQIKWSRGGIDDTEDDHDGREPDSDNEPDLDGEGTGNYLGACSPSETMLSAGPSGVHKSRATKQTHIIRSPLSGLITDGRESYLRDITYAAFWEMLNKNGRVPDVTVLQAQVWLVFSRGADLKDGRYSKKDAAKYSRNILKRHADGKISTTALTPQIVSDVPPTFRPAFLEGDGASKRLNKVMRIFCAAVKVRTIAKRELELARKSLDHLDKAERRTELRRVRADLKRRYGQKCLTPPRLQIAASAGLGKTSSFISLLVELPDLQGLHINYYVPTIERARELEADLHAALLEQGDANSHNKVQVMYGRSDPKHGRCREERKGLVASVEKKAPSVYNAMCLSQDASEGVFPVEVKCPFHDWCQSEDGYLSQFTDKGPKLRIWPHAQLRLEQSKDLKLPEADLVIVDESCVSTLCQSTPLGLSELTNAHNFLGEEGGMDQRALEIGGQLLRAIKLENGSVQLDSLTFSNITSDDLRTAEAAARRAAERNALVVQPHWPPESIRMKADEHQFNAGAVVAGILGALAASIEAGRKTCVAVSLEEVPEHQSGAGAASCYELVWSRSSRPMVPAGAGLLLLDADANVEINRRLFGSKLRHVTLGAKRRGYVKQVYTAPYANETLSSANGSALRAKLKAYVEELVGSGKKVLIGCNLKVRRALTGEIGKVPQAINWVGASVTHFGAFAGSNAWEDFDVVVVLGREQPPPTAVENMARAVWPDEEMDLQGQYMPEVRGYHLRNGERAGVQVACHPDPRVQMILELKRERATGQLIDRLRLMYPDDRKPEILLISNIPIPGLVVDELVSLDELLNGGSQWKRAMTEVGGVLPLQSEYLAQTLPAIFPSVSTAARAVSRLHSESWRHLSGTRIVQYRYVSRGPLSSALVAEGAANVRQQLASRHGTELRQIVVVECQADKPCQPANNIIGDVTGFVRLSDGDFLGVIPKPMSKGSWQILARQLGKPLDAVRKRFERNEPKALKAAYEGPGSHWRLHLKGDRYAVDIKLPAIAQGDQASADFRVKLAGLEVSWLVPMEPKRPTAKILLFAPPNGRGSLVKLNNMRSTPVGNNSGHFVAEGVRKTSAI